jgi:heme exporter protein CcmD
MSSHSAFVWTAYVVALATLLSLTVASWLRRRRALAELAHEESETS